VNNCDPFHLRHHPKAGASVARGAGRSGVNCPASYLGRVRDCRSATVHGSRWEVVAEPGPPVAPLLRQVRRPLDDCQRVDYQ